ncbi:Radical SAM superfamily enzyme YgiQ, UPF0313 family [Allochromatium warmingii]|uniref:Radical SAM superfamily enzyme YgiQ, UPF0313 family n=1 Tax=Allochromatium warmingii TaxID=61595 RepID=A0A1H3D662_ALLWA|nr:radical SAM protein [Allochromatium warmingii]SDX62002.1 Radical SAM superfamily enzyme YgiQ, UPF0313 family [Allochromatium warmingii]
MNITLISPYPDLFAYGIRILSACLKKNNHNVKIIFLPNGIGVNYSEKMLDALVELSADSDLNAISLMTDFLSKAIQISEYLRAKTSVPILWGGIHTMLCPTQCLKYADMICEGEGEDAFVELANRLEAGEKNPQVAGIRYQDSETTNISQRSLILDLDSLPFPDYAFDNQFILDDRGVRLMNAEILTKYNTGMYATIATRGCPFSCTYCCNSTFNSINPKCSTVRRRGIENLLLELVWAKENIPNIDRIALFDDAFMTYSKKSIEQFCEGYQTRVGLPLNIGGMTPTTFDKEKLGLLVGAGLNVVRMGIQSGSDRTKKLYGRNYSNNTVIKAAHGINSFKDIIMVPAYDIIIDNPWEKREDLVEKLMLLSELPLPFMLNIFSLTLYPGSKLYEIAQESGLLETNPKVVEKNYLIVKNVYLNKLFILLNQYSRIGWRISPKMMNLLTNPWMSKVGISWSFYVLLKLGALVARAFWVVFRIKASWNAISSGQWFRIIKYLKQF